MLVLAVIRHQVIAKLLQHGRLAFEVVLTLVLALALALVLVLALALDHTVAISRLFVCRHVYQVVIGIRDFVCHFVNKTVNQFNGNGGS
jgi:hypothetical protein